MNNVCDISFMFTSHNDLIVRLSDYIVRNAPFCVYCEAVAP